MMQFNGIEFPADFQGNVKKAFATRQNALDAKCIALMEDYTPIAMRRFRNRGKMSKSHRQESPGVIINTEPKARREYYTNKGGSGGKRGKYWFRRCVADHKEELRKTAKEGK
jgi:hypothetical protein